MNRECRAHHELNEWQYYNRIVECITWSKECHQTELHGEFHIIVKGSRHSFGSIRWVQSLLFHGACHHIFVFIIWWRVKASFDGVFEWWNLWFEQWDTNLLHVANKYTNHQQWDQLRWKLVHARVGDIAIDIETIVFETKDVDTTWTHRLNQWTNYECSSSNL